ncbi:MAG TPA: HEAT repeat domain-containing protein [Trichormus sp.]|jgi:hypothetical protein
MSKDISNVLSDCRYVFNGDATPELEFGVMLKPEVVLDAVRKALRTQGLFWRQGGPAQLTFYRNIQGINRPIPFHVDLWRINSMQTRVFLTADFSTACSATLRTTMKELNSLKQIFQIEVCSQPGMPTPEWVKKLVLDPTLPPFVLSYLAKHKDPNIRIAVADNPLTPLNIIQLLARDKDVDVRYAIAENHNISRSVLTYLSDDSNAYVAWRAAKTLARLGTSKPASLWDLTPTAQEFSMAMPSL